MSQRIRIRVTVLYKDQTRLFLLSVGTSWTIQQVAKHVLQTFKNQFNVHKGVRDHLTVSSITTDGYYMSKFQKVKNLLLNDQHITCQIQVVKKSYINQQQAFEVKIEHSHLVAQKKEEQRVNIQSMQQQPVQIISSQSDAQEDHEQAQVEGKLKVIRNQPHDYIKDKERQLQYYNQDKVYLSLDKIQKSNLKKQLKKEKRNRKKQKKKLQGDIQPQQSDSSSQQANKIKCVDTVFEKKIVETDKKIVTLPSENVEKKIAVASINEVDKKQNSSVMQVEDPLQKIAPTKIPQKSVSKDSLNLKISLSEESMKKLQRDFEKDRKNKQIITQKTNIIKPYNKTCSPKIIFHKEDVKNSPMSGPMNIQPIRKPSGDFNLNKSAKSNHPQQTAPVSTKKSIQTIKQSVVSKQTYLKQSGLKNSRDSNASKQAGKDKMKVIESQKKIEPMSVQIVAESSSDQQQVLKNVSPKVTLNSQAGPKPSNKFGDIEQLMNRYNIMDSEEDNSNENEQEFE